MPLRRALAALAAPAASAGRAALVALGLCAAAPAAFGDGGVDATATLHLRATSTSGVPSGELRYDVARRTFATEGYLVPQGSARYGSVFASLALGGRLPGELRWALAFDTGELRRERSPERAEVCWALPGASPTGLDGVESGNCQPQSPVFLLDETRLADPELGSNGRPVADEAEATLFLREAYASYGFGRAGFAVVTAGRRRAVIGDGLVHDDYATGLALDLDLGAVGPPLDLSLALLLPTRDLPDSAGELSPLVALRADYLPSLFEHVGLFAAAYRDRVGSVAETTREALLERLAVALSRAPPPPPPGEAERAAQLLAASLSGAYRGEATLFWAGTSGSLAPVRGTRLEWTAALLAGRLERIAVAPALVIAEDVRLRGRALSLRAEADLGRRASAGAFLLYLSGGTMPAGTLSPSGAVEPATGEFDGFLGVAPYVTATHLFFGGGLSESFAARRASAPGVNGHGVIAPGVRLTVDPTDALSLEASLAWLGADGAGPHGGDRYGVELDLVATWAPRGWMMVGAELDALWPGDFFGGRDTVYKAVLAVDLVTP